MAVFEGPRPHHPYLPWRFISGPTLAYSERRTMTQARLSLGKHGEDLACRELRRRGYAVLARRYRTRWGEIDIAARDGGTLVFVEVKTRRTRRAGHPVESVTPVKQQQLTRLALAWLKRHRLLERPARFDVVTVDWPDDARRPVIEHIRDAFDASGCDSMYS